MKTVLQRQGEKYFIEIDNNTLEGCAIEPDSILELTSFGRSIVLSPADAENIDVELEAILEELAVQYGQSLKKLAE